MTIRQRSGGLPETTRRFLAGLPRHGDPVGAVWNRLAELEAGNDSTVVDALRAVLLPHQPPRFGRCPACPKRWWRRRRWPCVVWCRVHLALFNPWLGTEERRSGSRGVAGVRVRVVGDPWVEIEAVCEVHGGSGRLVIRRDGERIVLDAHADECCVITVEGAGMTLLFDVLGEWLG